MSVINLLLLSLLTVSAHAYNLNRTIFAPNEFDGAICEKQVSAFFFSDNTQLLATPYLTYNEITEEQCLKTCSENRDTKGRFIFCSSFNFDHSTLTCTIFRVKSFPTGEDEIKFKQGMRYYEKFCVDEIECGDTKFLRSEQSVIIGYARNVSITATFEECAAQCLKERFRCRSAMYFYEEGECITNTESAETKPESYAREESDKVIYFENGCSAVLETQSKLEKYDDYESENDDETNKNEQVVNPTSTTLAEYLKKQRPSEDVGSDSHNSEATSELFTSKAILKVDDGEKQTVEIISRKSNKPGSIKDSKFDGLKQESYSINKKSDTIEKEKVNPNSLETKSKKGSKKLSNHKETHELKRKFIGMKQVTEVEKDEFETENEERTAKGSGGGLEDAWHIIEENDSDKMSTEKSAEKKEAVIPEASEDSGSFEVVESSHRDKTAFKQKTKPEVAKNQQKFIDEPNEGVENVRGKDYKNTGISRVKAITFELPGATDEEIKTSRIYAARPEGIGKDEVFRGTIEKILEEKTRTSEPKALIEDSMHTITHTHIKDEEDTDVTTEKEMFGRFESTTEDESSTLMKPELAQVAQTLIAPPERVTEPKGIDQEKIEAMMLQNARASGVIQKYQKKIKFPNFASGEDDAYFSEWTAWSPCKLLGERRVRRRKCYDLKKCIGALMEVEKCTSDHLGVQVIPTPPPSYTADRRQQSQVPQDDLTTVPTVIPTVLDTYATISPINVPPATTRRYDEMEEDDRIWSSWSGECQTFASGQPCKDHEMIGFQSRECLSKEMSMCTGPFFRYCTIPC